MPLLPVIGDFVNVPTSSGGSPIVTPGVAYITSAGNDSTGDGSINKPWRTVQKAADEEFYYWHLGANFNAGPVNFGGTESVTLYIIGEGYTGVIGAMTNHGFEIQIYDLGLQTFTVSSINTSGVSGGGGAIDLQGVLVVGSLDSRGAMGEGGGVINLRGYGVVSGTINCTGSAAIPESGNNGGNGGAVTILHGYQVNGNIDASGGAPDGGGNPGGDGAILILLSWVIGTLTPNSATVQGAVIGSVFYANTYPATSGTTTPVNSITTVGDSVSSVS